MLKTGTWLLVIEAWSINFHSVSAPLLYTKLHIPWIVEQICWLPAASCAVWKLEQPQEMDPKYYVSIDIIKMTTFEVTT